MSENSITFQVDLAPVISKIDQLQQEIQKLIMTHSPNSKWLTIEKTCELLQISKRTLQGYRDKGLLPFSQVGSKIYFSSEDIEKFMENHYVKAWDTSNNNQALSSISKK